LWSLRIVLNDHFSFDGVCKTVNKLGLTILLCLGFSLNAPIVFSEQSDSSSVMQVTPVHSSEGVLSLDVKYVDDTVHLLLGKKIQGADSLWYQASGDQGQTWSEAVNITEGQVIDARISRGNDARLAIQGNHIVAIWMSKKEGGRHNAGPMVAMASSDKGKTWQQIASPADWDGAHGFFAMDANADEMSLVWLDSRTKTGDGATQGLRYSRSIDGGQTWSTNQTLDERSCACCWNTAQYHGNDFYVLYRDKDPSDMTLGKVDAEQQWQKLSTVGAFDWDFQGCPHIGGSIAFDKPHQLIHSTVGTGHPEKTGTYYLSSSDMGKTWSSPHRLGEETAVHSDLAVSANGDVIAVWDMITEHGFQIVFAESDNQGQSWSDQVMLSALGIRATHPRTVAMKTGFLVLWTEGEAKKASYLRIVKVD
jgi:hypothetical protein